MKSISLALILSCFFAISADGADVEYSGEYDNSTVVKTVDGIRFQVPEDRPIEHEKGFIRPMPLDAYVAMKFSKIEERLREMEDSISSLKNEFAVMKGDLAAAKEVIKQLNRESERR